MKKLERSLEPNCFRRLRIEKPNDWVLTNADRVEIWGKLHEMQNRFCAYCESKFVNLNCHIEHLIPQNILKKIPNRSIYEWDNIYGSCDNAQHCGRYKDHKVTNYDSNNLIKADIENASDFLNFLPNGHVSPKQTLRGDFLIKASETIRVLNLDCSRLVNLREKKIGEFQMVFSSLSELIECADPENLEDKQLLQQELEQFEVDIQNNEYFISVRQNTIG